MIVLFSSTRNGEIKLYIYIIFQQTKLPILTISNWGCVSVGQRSNNFIVGLTNNGSALHAPVMWKYTLCGQYPGVVPAGATVTVQCANVYKRRLHFRYVVVHFPLINEPMNVCEIEVFTVGMHLLYPVSVKYYTVV